ncbi:MAG: hypothetical protein HC906_18095 [Bacteroidales bacterium]|nr:hypothetical protein [Bacteroidales bacterium]
MEKQTRTKIFIAISIAALMLLSVIFFTGKNSMKRQLQEEKIKYEASISDKLQLGKAIDRLKKEIIEMNKKNESLEKSISATHSQMQEKEAEIKRLSAQNASVTRLKKHIEELEKLKEKLNNEISDMAELTRNLKAENEKLSSMLATVQKDNELLEYNNSILRAMTADNYQMEALKGKQEKLTVNARRTKKLFVAMEIPSDSDKGLYFKMVTPEGEEYSSKTDESANIKVVDTPAGLLADKDNPVEKLTNGKKRVEMSYMPSKKLKKGVYQFKIYNDKTYVGSTQLRLK